MVNVTFSAWNNGEGKNEKFKLYDYVKVFMATFKSSA